MEKPKDPTKQATAKLVKLYMKERKNIFLAAREITRRTSPGFSVTRTTIYNWMNGTYMPSHLTALQISLGDRWVGNLGKDMLALLTPDHYKPVTQIGWEVYNQLVKGDT